MKLVSFEYNDFTWALNKVSFGNLNLIAGRNAVGKSKTLNAIISFVRFLNGEVNTTTPSHCCKVEFITDDNIVLKYSYEYKDSVITDETLFRGDDEIISRNKEHALIGNTEVNPPANKLCVQSQRDTKNYPEFESIMQWAELLKGYSFSELSSTKSYLIPSMFNEKIDISDIFEALEKDAEKKNFVIEKMEELGYVIEKIELLKISEKYSIVLIKEQGVNIPLYSALLSNGMLRVLYIFAYMAYLSTEQGARTLLVDDLGEGLDFSRSSKLSKIIFDYCEAHDIQLIVTSNDNFLMNAINLDHWVILQRDGEHTTGISNKTHPDMFLKFKKMGLNNFDMLSTDFIYRYLEKAKEE
jgi:AAA15 family ATPase/GTPase